MYDDISDYGMAFGKKEKFIWISTRAKKKAGGWGEETDDISSLRHPTELLMYGPCVSRGAIICSSGEWKNTFY